MQYCAQSRVADHPLKFDETVARTLAQVEFDSSSACNIASKNFNSGHPILCNRCVQYYCQCFFVWPALKNTDGSNRMADSDRCP